MARRLVLVEGQGMNIVARLTSGDRVELVQGGCAQDVEDERQLVAIMPFREDDFEVLVLGSWDGEHDELGRIKASRVTAGTNRR